MILPLEQVEREAILAALRVTGGHRGKAARALRISERTIRNKLRGWELRGILDAKTQRFLKTHSGSLSAWEPSP